MSAKKDLTGVLFKNDRKTTDKHPDYKGQCVMAGVEFWIAGWINEHAERGKYMSLKFSVKEGQSEKLKQDAAEDEDIPF